MERYSSLIRQVHDLTQHTRRAVHHSVSKTAPLEARNILAVDGARLVAGGGGEALFDFPQVAAGRTMLLVKGSKVGLLSPKGSARVERLDANGATFSLNATAVGQSTRFQMTIERVDGSRVRITSKNMATGMSQMVLGTLVASRANYAKFQASDGSGATTVYQNPAGQIVINTTIPGYGATHLILQ